MQRAANQILIEGLILTLCNNINIEEGEEFGRLEEDEPLVENKASSMHVLVDGCRW